MGIFASQTQDTIPIPFDAPHTVTIQKLTGRAIELSAEKHYDDFIAGRRPRGWPALFQRAMVDGLATAQDAAKAIRDPLAGYDRLSIAQHGVTAWSYPRPVTPAAIADLDDEALEWMAVEVMKLTKPALFQTVEEVEADRKNG